MAHHVVYAGTDRRRETLVSKLTWGASAPRGVRADPLVDVRRGHTRAQLLAYVRERRRGSLSRAAHGFDFERREQPNRHSGSVLWSAPVANTH